MIPQISLILPIRCRTTFTTNALASLIEHGVRKDHQIILVLDKTSLTYELQRFPNKFPPNVLKEDEEGMKKVDNWINIHSNLLKNYDINIVTARGGSDLWLDHRRISFVLEEGRKYVKHNWVMGYADEDLVFQRHWDENLWRYMENRDHTKFCVVPSKVVPTFVDKEPDISFIWLNDYINFVRKGSWLILPLPISDKRVLERKYRIPFKKFDNYIENVLVYGNAFSELCGIRDKGDSSPFFIHKSLMDSVGGWSIEGPYSDCHSLDARFDYRLGGKGITKLIPRDCFVLHTKNPLFISTDIDNKWGDVTDSPVSGNVSPWLL